MPTKHDRTATRLAKREGVSYNRGKGADIKAPGRAIEVETAETVKDGLRQLQGYRMPVYIAGDDEKATAAAVEVTEGKTAGVMDPNGRIVKPSTRRR